jgi:hypothetical protein
MVITPLLHEDHTMCGLHLEMQQKQSKAKHHLASEANAPALEPTAPRPKRAHQQTQSHPPASAYNGSAGSCTPPGTAPSFFLLGWQGLGGKLLTKNVRQQRLHPSNATTGNDDEEYVWVSLGNAMKLEAKQSKEKQ